jgi:hypothetical protein
VTCHVSGDPRHVHVSRSVKLAGKARLTRLGRTNATGAAKRLEAFRTIKRGGRYTLRAGARSIRVVLR